MSYDILCIIGADDSSALNKNSSKETFKKTLVVFVTNKVLILAKTQYKFKITNKNFKVA